MRIFTPKKLVNPTNQFLIFGGSLPGLHWVSSSFWSVLSPRLFWLIVLAEVMLYQFPGLIHQRLASTLRIFVLEKMPKHEERPIWTKLRPPNSWHYFASHFQIDPSAILDPDELTTLDRDELPPPCQSQIVDLWARQIIVLILSHYILGWFIMIQ